MKKVLIMLAVLAAVAAAFFGLRHIREGMNKSDVKTNIDTASRSAEYRKISSDQAQEMMKTEKDNVILDVRTAGEYAEGHIPGAVNLPLDQIGSGDIASLPEKDQLVMVYCRSGNRSAAASKKLVEKGYTRVIDFGGINTWKGEVVK